MAEAEDEKIATMLKAETTESADAAVADVAVANAAVAEGVAVGEPKKVSGYAYSKEHKLKRYYACLRDFMMFFHKRSEAYPSDHEFTDDELSAIEPKDIVNWMNVKMFGTLDPDFSAGKTMSGSHHTLAFYRKGIGYFMPSGNDDWDPVAKRGNPTRSKAIRDLINKVKELNADGIATPKKTGKRKNTEDYVPKQKKSGGGNPKKKAKITSEPLPFTVSEEVNGLLRHMHVQKNKFMRSLEDMGAAVEKMKRDVETSYGVMISQVTNIGSRIVTANENIATPLAPLLRSRNLFTVWNVSCGKLTPLADDWNFPTKLTVLEAVKMWMLGEPSNHTPPLQYLTVGHMKHVKGAADSFNKVRRCMKIIRYLGLKASYWCENWDGDRIATLWSKIRPGIEAHLGHLSDDAKDGGMSCRTLINSLSKHGGIGQEMADNPEMLTDELVASFVVRSTEEASQGAHARDESGDTEDASASTPPSTRNLELLWGIHHGKLNPLPEDWEFPITSSIIEALNLWLLGEPERKIPPFKYVHSSYVGYLKSGSGYLSKLRCVMKVVTHFGVKHECWHEEGWDDEKIAALWHTVWDNVEERIKFKRTDGRKGAVTWQSVYNRMHESGLIKDVSADQDNKDVDEDNDVDQDKGAGQDEDLHQDQVEDVHKDQDRDVGPKVEEV